MPQAGLPLSRIASLAHPAMKNHHHLAARLSASLAGAVLLGLAPNSWAGPPASTPLPPPPVLPRQFDQATLQQLIDTAEQGQNAIILKFGYFLHRTPEPVAPSEGFSLLKATIEKEPVGTRRWFVLQMVRGFAGFRVGPGTKVDAYQAYETLFDKADEADKAKAIDVVQSAILDYASTIYGGYGVKNDNTDTAKAVLLKALDTHLKYLPQTGSADDIPWDKAIGAVGSSAQFAAVVEKVLASPDVPQSYSLLRTAARVIGSTNLSRSVELLQKAKLSLPKGDIGQAQSLYELLVQDLSFLTKWDEAVAAQKELVQLTSKGYAQLAVLQWQQGDEKGLDATLASLSMPTANENEINETAQALYKTHVEGSDERKKLLPDKAVSLLQAYLKTNRTRTLEQELRARYWLGQMLIAAGDLPAARAALMVEAPIETATGGMAKAYYARIQQLLRSMPAR
jgi:hypothetical protein